MTTITAYTSVRDGIRYIDAWFENVRQADQIVIQDGGSTDGTVERLLELQKTHPNVTLVLQREDNEKYKWNEMEVRNQLLTLFKCEFILLTDVDELIDDHFWDWAKNTGHTVNGYYMNHKNLWLSRDVFNMAPPWYPDSVMKFFRNYSGFVWVSPTHASVWRLGPDGVARQINQTDEDMAQIPNDIHLVHYHRSDKDYAEMVFNDEIPHHSDEKRNLETPPILARLRQHPTGAGLIKPLRS